MAINGTAGAVVITGASTGIGEACALRLDRTGFYVFAGVRKPGDGERLKSQASERLVPLIIDVTDAASIERAAQTVANAAGEAGLAGLAGLVNNAGVSVPGPLEFLPIDELRRQLEVNVVGQIAVTQAFLPLIRKRRGRIVNMGSIGGRMATAFIGAYNASKFAMEALTDALRQELRPWGIHVSIVEPGSIATPIWEKAQATGDELEKTLPAQAMTLYGPTFTAMRAAARKFEAAGIPPDEVAKFVEHALTARTPKTRYVVGRDAQLQRVLVKVAPDRLRDRLVAQQLGLPGKAS
jgi:NAD(P)-dependent dehydrogenase (short-subunit alcohol dehydrogenase family)